MGSFEFPLPAGRGSLESERGVVVVDRGVPFFPRELLGVVFGVLEGELLALGFRGEGLRKLLPDADLCRLFALGELGMLLLGEGLAAAEDPARDFLPPGAGELVPLPPGL